MEAPKQKTPSNREVQSGSPDGRRDVVKRSFVFSLKIIRLCRQFEKHSTVGRGLARQLFRAGTSIGANVEEGQAAQSTADFVNKNAIALKEARETTYWLRLVAESDLLDREHVDPLVTEAKELSLMLGAIVSHTKAKAKKGVESL